MSITEFAAATLAVILGSVVQVMSGIGGGFVVVPLLAWMDIDLVPAPLLFGSLSLSMIMAARERNAIDWDHVPAILIGTIPGSMAGAFILSRMPASKLGLVFGPVILLAIAITASGVKFRRTRLSALISGALSGGMGTSSGIGAPLVAILYQHDSGPRIRATLAAIYAFAAILILIILAGFGKFTVVDMRSGAMLMPGFVIGYWVASRFTVHVDRGRTRIAVLVVSAAAAMALILRSLA